jgi:hypothetical protein
MAAFLKRCVGDAFRQVSLKVKVLDRRYRSCKEVLADSPTQS